MGMNRPTTRPTFDNWTRLDEDAEDLTETEGAFGVGARIDHGEVETRHDLMRLKAQANPLNTEARASGNEGLERLATHFEVVVIEARQPTGVIVRLVVDPTEYWSAFVP